MLYLFGRQRQGNDPAAGDQMLEQSLTSHVLPRFIKRIRAVPRPNVLDLGRLSGANIEFFGRIGCRLHIEDLLTCLEDTAHAAAASVQSTNDAPLTSAPPAAQAAPGSIPVLRDADPVARPARREPVRPDSSPRQAGQRPRRHIVLPPRTFPSAGRLSGIEGGRARRPDAVRSGSWKSPLPTRFAYPDEAFHAVLAWDVFDFYDPESARRVAAEIRRILKPGGLLLSFFHARRMEGPDRPRRYRILDETHFACEETSVPPMPRHMFHNRDIEKMFAGLKIVEQYFLKNSLREILMEKKIPGATPPRRPPVSSLPKPRFRID